MFWENVPFERRFAFFPQAMVYLPGLRVPVSVQGAGWIKLGFEASDQPGVLRVALRDAKLRLAPFLFPMDIDQDGQRECLELCDVQIDGSGFDREASRGHLDLKSGDFRLIFAYTITPKQVPLLGQLGKENDREVRIVVEDRGRMDLERGTFEIHGGIKEVDSGPLAGAWIRGGGPGRIDYDEPPPSTIRLKVVIATPGRGSCQDGGADQVWICPGDRILLCWESSSDVVSVDLDPGGYTGLPRSGVRFETPATPAPGAPRQVVYNVRTNGGNTPGTEDSVVVTFYGGEALGPYQANPDRIARRWSLSIPPESVSGRIEVNQVQIETHGCLNWGNFFLEHIPAPPPAGPGGGPDFGGTLTGLGPARVTPFPAAGTWNFYAQPSGTTAPPDAADSQLPVCFRFRGACRLP